MEDLQVQGQGQDSNSPPNHVSERTSEPVRSRWTPKPEQILILESIFNSGMVNPPKEETVRIRKLLEKFGAVGDANVFYWFQNRRSRSRRRQRQMQANLEQRNNIQLQAQVSAAAAGTGTSHSTFHGDGGAIQYQITNLASGAAMGFGGAASPCFTTNSMSNYLVGGASSFSCGGGGGVGHESLDGLSSVSCQMGFLKTDQNSAATSSVLYPSDASNLHYQSGLISVFMNGVPTEVPRGPLDMKTMFGADVVLVHSSGVPLPTNEYGFLLQSLQHGESYFLVSRPT
ncbi:WUSCHEL-related homeobox like [Quillaja saponaria]|uniref:WUSCHEL-related homeobox like n=1 Tax=Quillaja saponaria TaxID=32244 RepID=A0AAD7Q7X4_QUISA|nr:WUSCHEL-related homeobox like [Quillaja saponaria]